MKQNTIMMIGFLILALIILNFCMKKMYEGFTTLTPGNFPNSVNVPILHEYPLKDIMGISKQTYEENSSYYPIFGNSYQQVTNNVRYWATPNNGKCSPAEFCGGLYNNKKINIPDMPKIIPFSSPDIRVNYYSSTESC
jgi:hypothetical protein